MCHHSRVARVATSTAKRAASKSSREWQLLVACDLRIGEQFVQCLATEKGQQKQVGGSYEGRTKPP